MKKSGQILLKGKTEFYPGDAGEVEISFVDRNFLGDSFGIGTEFTFSEGKIALGEGRVLEIVN